MPAKKIAGWQGLWGWHCSDRTKRRAERLLPRFEDIVVAEAKRYTGIPGLDAESLLQEGRLLATYALDTWEKRRGKNIRGWVGLVVRTGLHTVVNHEKALKRAPRELTHGTKRRYASRRESRLAEFASTEAIEQTVAAPRQMSLYEQIEGSAVVQRVLDGLDANERAILMLRLSPPPELTIAARNTHPRNPMVTNRLIAEYLGIPLIRVRRAMESAKQLWREIDADL